MEVDHCACSLLHRMAERRRTFNVESLADGNLVRTLGGDTSTPFLWAPSGLPTLQASVPTDVVMVWSCDVSAASGNSCDRLIEAEEGRSQASCSSADRSRSCTPVPVGSASLSASATGSSVYQWGRRETLLLLNLYVVYKEELTDKKTKKRSVWKKIAEELTMEGVHVSCLQCENRWKTLKSLFCRTIDHNKKTGTYYETTNFYCYHLFSS